MNDPEHRLVGITNEDDEPVPVRVLFGPAAGNTATDIVALLERIAVALERLAEVRPVTG